VPRIKPFYSADEVDKPAIDRIYHNNLLCSVGNAIKKALRRMGTAGYQLCPVCETINREGR
jgi:hypothetical protein